MLVNVSLNAKYKRETLVYAEITSDVKSIASPQPEKAADSEKKGSAIGEFARTLAYSAIQTPVTAVSQILDKATGTNVAPNINMIDRADDASFGSARWHVQQVAAGVGALVPFVAALAVTKNISRAVQAEELALKYCASPIASTVAHFRTGEMAVAGLLQGAVLEPNQNKDKFFQERFTQGITSGITMGSMHAFSNKFAGWTGASASGASLLNKSLTTGLAGGAGGLVGLEAHGILTGESLTGMQAVQSVYQAAFTGAALGALGSAQLRLHQPKSGLTAIENHVAKNDESVIFSETYFDRHKERTSGWHFPKDGAEPRPLTPFERVEMVSIMHRDADPLLRQPKTIDSFLEKVRGTSSDHFSKADLKDDDVVHRMVNLRRALDVRPGEGESKQDVRDYAAIKRLHKKALKAGDETGAQLDAAQESYRARLETATNKFLSEHNLPPIDLLVGDPDTFKPSADYANGEVTVRHRLIGPPESEGELVNAVYHELTHLRQDALHINVIADRLGLPPEPNAADIQRVKNEFRRTALDDLKRNNPDKPAGEVDNSIAVNDAQAMRGDQLVEDVLRIRKNHPLSAAEKAMAEKTSDNVVRYEKDSANKEISKRLSDAEFQIDLIGRFMDGEPNKFITSRFFSDMVDDPKVFEQYYGIKTASPELSALEKEHHSNPLSKIVDLDTVEGNNAWEAQQSYFNELKERLHPILAKQLDVLEQQRDSLSEEKRNRYYRNPLEQQAFPTGMLAELSHQSIAPQNR